MALSYSWAQLIERLTKHINNNFPTQDFSVTDNEMLLYINEAMSFGLIGQVYNGAKMLGYMEMPEGYILRFELPLATDDITTGQFVTTLPQPPVSLPLGYSINRIYPANGEDVVMIKAKRVGNRKSMPLQYGIRAWVMGNKLYMAASNGTDLTAEKFYVDMPSTRAINITDAINLPDDAVDMIFTKVVARLKDRMAMPKDVVQDGLPSGN